jgi:hypothetical protein
VEADEVNEDAEISKASKSLLGTSKLSRFFILIFGIKFVFGRIMK